mmetsp:Transcript_22498/g.56245  ORF Transcript_22498/g.56245 Transcript_22498/m.56245 type:complete len:238 (+) Transcript_22498:302-1015(+)
MVVRDDIAILAASCTCRLAILQPVRSSPQAEGLGPRLWQVSPALRVPERLHEHTGRGLAVRCDPLGHSWLLNGGWRSCNARLWWQGLWLQEPEDVRGPCWLDSIVRALAERREAVQGGHLRGYQLEVQKHGVFPDPVPGGSLRDHCDAVLETPAMQDLRRRPAAPLRDRDDMGILQWQHHVRPRIYHRVAHHGHALALGPLQEAQRGAAEDLLPWLVDLEDVLEVDGPVLGERPELL